MKKFYIILAGLIALSTSCSTYRYEEHQSRVSQMGSSGLVTSTTADLNVSPTKVNYTETFTQKENENETDIRYAKDYTLTKAMMKYNADVFVGALYDITTSEDGKTITVTISGYPASYTNFRPTTSEDSLLIAVATPFAEKEDLKTSSLLLQDWNVKKRWENSLSFVYSWNERLIGGEYSGGKRFNNWSLFGFGFGYANSLDNKDHYIPLYLQLKFFIVGKKRINPYIGLSQGVAVRILPQENKVPILTVGSHTRGEIGINFRTTLTTNLSFAYVMGTSPQIYFYDMTPVQTGTNTQTSFYFAKPLHYFYNGIKLSFTF